jgi:hypothetical protein
LRVGGREAAVRAARDGHDRMMIGLWWSSSIAVDWCWDDGRATAWCEQESVDGVVERAARQPQLSAQGSACETVFGCCRTFCAWA